MCVCVLVRVRVREKRGERERVRVCVNVSVFRRLSSLIASAHWSLPLSQGTTTLHRCTFRVVLAADPARRTTSFVLARRSHRERESVCVCESMFVCESISVRESPTFTHTDAHSLSLSTTPLHSLVDVRGRDLRVLGCWFKP